MFRQNFENTRPDVVPVPLLESSMACGRRRVTFRQVLPGSAGAQDPKNAVKNSSIIGAGTAFAVIADCWLGYVRSHHGPLLVGKVHNVGVTVNGISISF